jgi:DNA-binding GntR family transcriptional regulator
MNAAFHGRLAAATGNEYVHEFATRLYNHARRLSYLTYLSGEGRDDLRRMGQRIVSDHDEVIRAVAGGDNGALVEILTRHAAFFHERIIRTVGVVRGFDAPLPAGSKVVSQPRDAAAG